MRECSEFPGGLVVRTLNFHCRRHGFDLQLGELRSHMQCNVTNKNGEVDEVVLEASLSRQL